MNTQAVWRTFYNHDIFISELSHQHLSNILWYYELINVGPVSPLIQTEIDNRFGGIRLPYYPLHSFRYEVNFLYNRGYISDRHDSDIIVNGKWIGRLEYR
jgi:hypothetical protein